MSRYRNWIGTAFNEGELKFPDWVQYSIYQIEKAPSTGRIHKQIYIECTKPVSLSALITWLPGSHWESRKGTQDQAIAYCSKQDTRVEGPFEHGSLKSQGKRNDLRDTFEAIKTGADTKTIMEEHTSVYMKYPKAVERMQIVYNPPKERPRPQIKYLFGPSGTGKSRLARRDFPWAYQAYDSKEGWFDGYDNEDTIIFDDFEGNFPLRLMLRLLDYGGLRLPVKGGFVNIKAYQFLFTSNYRYEDLYRADPAWIRRIREFAGDQVIEFNENSLAEYGFVSEVKQPMELLFDEQKLGVPVLPPTSVHVRVHGSSRVFALLPDNEDELSVPPTPVLDFEAECNGSQ